MRRTLIAVSLLLASCRSEPAVEVEFSGEAVANATAPGIVETDIVKTLQTTSWETQVAVSPVNPNVVLATAMHASPRPPYTCTVFRSEDGGRTWPRQVDLPMTVGGHTYGDHADPVFAFDRTGTAYCALLLLDRASSEPGNSSLALMKSTDEGRTWVATALTERHPSDSPRYLDDKEWLAVDNSGGQYDGSLYMAWVRALMPLTEKKSEMVFSYSRDGGATWSQPVSVGANTGGATLAVGPDGAVYFAHTGGSGYVLQVSHDGGRTFAASRSIASLRLPSEPMPNTSTQVLMLEQIAVDTSFGPTSGYLYFVYPGDGVGAYQLPASIFFKRSTDGGATWSPALRLSAPPSLKRDAILPSVASDPVTGRVLVTWLDRREDESNTLARVYVAESTDGGATFLPAYGVTSAFSMDTPFMGHYNSVAAFGPTRVAAFADAGGRFSVARIVERARRRAVR